MTFRKLYQVKITHLPTNETVTVDSCSSKDSPHKLKKMGLKLLISKLYAKWILKENINSKIITYEFPDDDINPDDPSIYKKKITQIDRNKYSARDKNE